MHDDARATDVPARFVPHFDGHLVAELQGLDGCVEQRSLGTTVDEGAQRHVARDPGEAVEVGDCHARVLLMCTAAASIGCMLAGRLATLTATAITCGTSRTRSAILAASVSRRLTDSPSTTSLAMARSFV